jgi:hypothetical protein
MKVIAMVLSVLLGSYSFALAQSGGSSGGSVEAAQPVLAELPALAPETRCPTAAPTVPGGRLAQIPATP